MTWLMVMLGGAVGSALRYGISLGLNPNPAAGMPWGTLVTNLLGCVLIGWFSSLLHDASEAVRLGVLVGILGGFTTFSSFGLEAIRLIQSGQMSVAIAYIAISNLGGLAGAYLGFSFAR
jgi:CrcB protein